MIKMNKFNMLITTVCVLFFIFLFFIFYFFYFYFFLNSFIGYNTKLRWPKNKSIYDMPDCDITGNETNG